MKHLGRQIPEPIRRQVAALRHLNLALENALPSALHGHIQAAALERNRLVLEADSPAWATKARYLEADITRRLRDDTGLPIRSLQLRVRPAAGTARARKRRSLQLSADSARRLNALAGEISHPELQQALSRLAKRAPGKRSGDR